MEQIEIILRSTDPAGKVTEQLLAKFDTEKPATEHDKVLQIGRASCRERV